MIRRRPSVRFVVVSLLGAIGATISVATSPQPLASADWRPYGLGPDTALSAVKVMVVRGDPGTRPEPVRAKRQTMQAEATPEPDLAPTTIVDGEERIYVEALRGLLGRQAPAYAAELEVIGICESGRWDATLGSWYVRPRAVGDSGNSLGWLQLWKGWPARLGPHLDPFNPVDAIRLAVAIREARGRWGGPGGWTCADLRGVP